MSVENYLLTIQNKQESASLKKSNSTSRDLKLGVVNKVKERIISSRDINIFNKEEALKTIESYAHQWIDEEINQHFIGENVTVQDKREIYQQLINSIFGFGVIEPLLKEKGITEIMINGCDSIFIEKEGRLQRAVDTQGKPLKFNNSQELKQVVDKIVAPINRKVDESNPIVDARLPDGSRVNVVLDPVSLDGVAVTIRKFPEDPYTLEDLVKFKSLSSEIALFLEMMVKSKHNIIVSGGTGSGKTTFLNALSSFIPEDERIITIEDSAELRFNQVNNKVRLEARPANIEERGEITIRDLVKASLRMRPNRIVVGEIRSGEALDMLQAMNTGHDGSLSTGHANSARDMLLRLETMVLMSGVDLPLNSIRRQIVSAIDLIVHINKQSDGTRKVVEICEVVDCKNDDIVLNPLFEYADAIGGGSFKKIGDLINQKKFKTFKLSGRS